MKTKYKFFNEDWDYTWRYTTYKDKAPQIAKENNRYIQEEVNWYLINPV